MAKIYENQGHTEDALVIYKEILKNDKTNLEVQKAVARITNTDTKKVSYFVKMHTKEHFEAFEKWLVKPWS
jgi:hypothetical protein